MHPWPLSVLESVVTSVPEPEPAWPTPSQYPPALAMDSRRPVVNGRHTAWRWLPRPHTKHLAISKRLILWRRPLKVQWPTDGLIPASTVSCQTPLGSCPVYQKTSQWRASPASDKVRQPDVPTASPAASPWPWARAPGLNCSIAPYPRQQRPLHPESYSVRNQSNLFTTRQGKEHVSTSAEKPRSYPRHLQGP